MEMLLISMVSAGLLVVGFWVYKLIQLRNSIKKYREYWQTRQSESGDFLYVALGDSAAQGVGATTIEASYVAQIATHVEHVTGKKVRVMNLSVSGAKTGDVIDAQLAELRRVQPDLVTLAIGGNDIKAYDSAQFTDHMKHIIAQLPAQSVIADASYFMHGRWMRDSKEMAKITTRLAQKNDVRVARLYSAMEAEGWNAMWNAYSADWFHPNNRGYTTWFRVFWEQVEPMLSDERQQR